MPLTTKPNQHAQLPASCSSPDGLEDKSLGSLKPPTGVRTLFPLQPEVSADVLGSHLTKTKAPLLSEAALLTKDSFPLEPVLWTGVRWRPWEVGEGCSVELVPGLADEGTTRMLCLCQGAPKQLGV